MDFNMFVFFSLIHLNKFMDINVNKSKNDLTKDYNDNNYLKKPLNMENQKVDINILKSRLKKKEDIILKRNIAILTSCLALFVVAAIYIEYI